MIQTADPDACRPDSSTTNPEAAPPDQAAIALASKRAAREAAIDKLMAEGQERGSTVDRTFWAMVYDFERAPSTTNRKQLTEIGVAVPQPADIPALSDGEVASSLRAVLDGLAQLHIYLLNTDHLDDRELLTRLCAEVFEEEVREVVGTDVQEWIDLALMEEGDPESRPKKADRDATIPRPSEWKSEAKPVTADAVEDRKEGSDAAF